MSTVEHSVKRRKRPTVSPPDAEDQRRWQAWLDAPAADKPRLWWLFQTRGRHDGEREIVP